MATQQHIPGSFFRIFNGEAKLATAVFTKHGKYLQVDPKPLVDYASLDDWKACFPASSRVDIQTPKERDEARKAWKAEQLAKKIAEQSADIAKVRALYDYYAIPDCSDSSKARLFVEIDGQIMAIFFDRRYNNITVSVRSGFPGRVSVSSFDQLLLGPPTRFWYKPDKEIMILAETELVPKEGQKIVYVSHSPFYFAKDNIINKCVKPLQAKGYFVYLQERNQAFERKMYNLKKESPLVQEVINCTSGGAYYRLKDCEKTPTKNILEWF